MSDEEIRTGMEVTDGKHRGVVTEGIPRKAGPWKGRVWVMWIGGEWPTLAWPAELREVTR